MKKRVLIALVIVIILIGILLILNKNRNIIITKFETEEGTPTIYYEVKEGISEEEYGLLSKELSEKCLNLSNEECSKLFSEVDVRHCVIYTNKNTLQLPSSCPGQVFPKGSRTCGAQSVRSYRGETKLRLHSSYVSLEDVKLIEVCCTDHEVNNFDIDIKKSDFECSKSFKI